MGKKNILFKGTIEGIATSTINGRCFVIKTDTNIEGIPNEFAVSHVKLWTMYAGIANLDRKLASTYIRPGDTIMVEGEIVEEEIDKEGLQIIRMNARLIYNKTLKCGFK